MHAHMSNYIVCSPSPGFNTSSHNTWIVLPLCVALPASCPCHHEKCFLYFNTMKHRTYSKRWWFTMRALPVICKINATGRPSVLQNILSSKKDRYGTQNWRLFHTGSWFRQKFGKVFQDPESPFTFGSKMKPLIKKVETFGPSPWPILTNAGLQMMWLQK